MAGSRRRERFGRRVSLLLFIYVAISFLWQTLSMSVAYGPFPWVPTNTIALYGWGAIAGALLGLPIVYAWYAFRLLPRFDATIPVARIRDRPRAAFLLGFAAGTVAWRVGLVVTLVVGGIYLAWPVVYAIGFAAGALVWMAVVYAIFLAPPYVVYPPSFPT